MTFTWQHLFAVLTACVAVIAASLVAAWSFWSAYWRRNPLPGIIGVGATLFVIGMVGEQAPEVSPSTVPGVWQANVLLPGNEAIDPIALAGLLIGLVGITLTLLIEVRGGGRERPEQAPLDVDDAV